MTVKVKAATLTIDTVEQFRLEVRRATRPTRSCACSTPSARARRSSSCARRSAATSSSSTLRDKGLDVKALHGDMSQGSRDGVMISFKDGRVQILVATDVAARGLDISTVTHIINYDIPTSPDVYVHRIGRTGRVGRSGRAITFVEPRQRRELEAIERHANTTIAPWTEGAHVGPSRSASVRAATRSRTSAATATSAGQAASCAAAARRASRSPTWSPRSPAATALDGEAVRNVRVLERFAFLEVPESDVPEVLDRVNGTLVRDTTLKLEPARS